MLGSAVLLAPLQLNRLYWFILVNFHPDITRYVQRFAMMLYAVHTYLHLTIPVLYLLETLLKRDAASPLYYSKIFCFIILL